MVRLGQVAVLALGLLGQGAAFAAVDCGPDRLAVQTPRATQVFNVEVAADSASRALGLMNRPSMPKSSGMLFVYEQPSTANFWMENTLIPLDMVFAGPDGVVTRVHANAIPMDRTVIPGGDNIQFVLEINGGLAKKMGIVEGSTMIHPAIGNCAK